MILAIILGIKKKEILKNNYPKGYRPKINKILVKCIVNLISIIFKLILVSIIKQKN
jgi:hypothetical protein